MLISTFTNTLLKLKVVLLMDMYKLTNVGILL